MKFRNRREAGRRLAALLSNYADRDDVLVLALPRGGVPVAFEIARELHAPLDVFLVRKLGVPGHEELAMGAIATGGVRIVNEEVVRSLGISEQVIDTVARRESEELGRREALYRTGRAPQIEGRTIIVVDDGLATGSTMRAAVKALRLQKPAEIIVAVPTGAAETCREFERLAESVVCAMTPPHFQAVGMWYEDFDQTSDEEVRNLLETAAGTDAQPVRPS